MTQDAVDKKHEEKLANGTDKGVKPDEKGKERRDATPTKVVVRRLPPSLTLDTFLEQISPVPEYDYLHFVKPDMSLGVNSFSRAYINFTHVDDIINFRERFDGYVFVDAKGSEYTAVVEFSPFQKVPKNKVRKPDTRNGTIEQDAEYLKLLEQLENAEAESVPPPETYLEEIEARARELKGGNGVSKTTTTPLLDYIKRKREDRQLAILRARDERKRRETERRRMREDDRRRKKEREGEKTRDRDREDQGVKPVATTPIKLLRNPERQKVRDKDKDDVERSKETTPSREPVAKETEKSCVTAARDQRLKSSRDRDKERTRDWDRGNNYRGKPTWEKEPFRREGSSGKTEGRDTAKDTKQPAPSSSQKEGGKEPGKYRPKDHSDMGRFPDKERSQSGTFRDKNREREADRTRDVNREKNRNRDPERDRAREKERDRGVNREGRGAGGSGWRFASKDASEREKGKVEKKNDSRTGDQGVGVGSTGGGGGGGGDKRGGNKGDAPCASAKSSGEDGKRVGEEHSQGNGDLDGKGKQKLRYKDRPARPIYNPGRRAAERRKEAENKTGPSKNDRD